MRNLVVFVLFICLFSTSYGAYLEKVPFQLVQPNGEILNVFITGDEFFRRVHDKEGYSIVIRDDGWYCYAIYDEVNDELVPSEYIVSSAKQVQLPMDKWLGISNTKYLEKRQIYYAPTRCHPSGASEKSILEDLAGARTTQQINNIVICIGFSDTEAMTNNFNHVNGMLHSNTNNNLRDFFLEMSYNKLDITSHFYPPADGNVLRFYQDENPRDYYRPYDAVDNPTGYSSYNQRTTREQTMLKNAINWVNENYPIPTDLNLDINNDGDCDYITFIIQGQVDGWNDLLWPHKWSLYLFNESINGKRVWDFNFMLDGTYYYFDVGTFAHEGNHVLGAPDLYQYNAGLTPVGMWDLMASSSTRPQSMSAYMKFRYGRWIYSNYTHTNFPAATINKTYEIFPFYFNDGSDPEKPIMHRIPMTGTTSQYSVIEYRKKFGTNYDSALPNEGLLIYRINTNMIGNAGFNGTSVFDEIFVYRPGSTQSGSSYSQGNLNQAPYNSVNRTAFNSSTDPKPYFSNGTAETVQNINNIQYDSTTDSYTFFYGDPVNRTMSLSTSKLLLTQTAGSSKEIEVTSNVKWNVTILSGASSWLSASVKKGLNNGTVEFTTLSDNDTNTDRYAKVVFSDNNHTFNVTVTQSCLNDMPYPVNNIKAEVSDNNALIEWMNQITPKSYILDDFTAENGLRFVPNNSNSLGNQFDVDEDGVLTSIDVYALKMNDNSDREVTINIYNEQRELVGSSEPFVFEGDGWVNVPLNNIPFSGTFYVMVQWSATLGQTHNLGYDQNGPNANAELNWFLNSSGVWGLLHQVQTIAKPGVFMIRANAIIDGNSVRYGSYEFEGYVIYRLTEEQPESDWTKLSDNLIDTKYIDINWSSLPDGIYQYAVKIKYDEGLSDAVLSNLLYKTVGINKLETDKFSIYPNPVNDILTLVRSANNKARIEIYNSAGLLVIAKQLKDNETNTDIDVKSLPSGVYSIRIIDNKTNFTQKFTVKN